MAKDVNLVTREYIDRILDSTGEKYEPLGRFVCADKSEDGVPIWVAVDNTTGEAFTEEFFTKTAATRWLHGLKVSNRFGEMLERSQRRTQI